jgi:hypothetical protein
MVKLLFRLALVAFVACVVAAAPAQKKDKSSYDLKYRYAFHRVGPDHSETDIMNWSGNINWDRHSHTDELWIGKNEKTYLITDKATLDAFEDDFGPLRAFNLQRDKYMSGYYEARGEQRSYDRQSRDVDRQISSLQRKRDRVKDNDQQKDIDEQISDLQKQKQDFDRQSADWAKKLEDATKKRQEFYDKREDIRADVYRKIDKLIDDAFAKGLTKPGTPD